jgi:AcrR family transcriptional regulator
MMNADKSRSMPPARARRLKKDEIRARLIQAAAEIFAAKGWEKTTLEEIAEAAGFSKGAVYSNFESKDELFFSLMERQIDDRIGMVETVLSDESDTKRRIEKVGAALMDLSRQSPEWQILFIEYWLRAARNPKLRERFVNRRRLMREKIAKMFEGYAAETDQSYPMPSSSYALTILALSNGLGIERIIDQESVSDGLLAQILSLLFQGTPDCARHPRRQVE